MNLLSLKVVTPERVVYEENEISAATLPTVDGQITVLPNHVPLLSKLETGEVVLKKHGKENSLVVADGFLKLDANGSMLILADYAVRSDDIEVAKVEEAKKRAEAAMKEKGSRRDFVIAEAELRRTLMELKVSRKRRSAKVST